MSKFESIAYFIPPTQACVIFATVSPENCPAFFLTRVSMIGNDMKLDTGVGTCGKEGQSVPVGVGQPTLRLDGLTVGGTA